MPNIFIYHILSTIGGTSGITSNAVQQFMTNVNYPLVAPGQLKHRQSVTAPSGYNIRIVIPSDQVGQDCRNKSYFEVGK